MSDCCSCSSSSPAFWVYNIPICGGFCAPTENPDQSFWRHFSNEYTVPLSRKFMKVAPVCEHSPCCVVCGKVGFAWADRHRKRIAVFSSVMNVVALVLSLLAVISGLSTSSSTLRRLPWVMGESTSGGASMKLNYYMGVKSRHDRVDCSHIPGANCTAQSGSGGWEVLEAGVVGRVVRWEDADSCSGPDAGLNAVCQKCSDSLISSASLIVGVVTQFPTIATDLQRSTRFGDVNCQATMGFLTNLLSFLSTTASLISFRRACYQAIDMICHAIVPTPRQRWQKPGPEVREVVDYMRLAPPEPEEMAEDAKDKPAGDAA